MKNPTIGIKIADGSYFPIMEEGSSKRKRLVLTTVNDNQESVQIDLYKGDGEELVDAAYVGSLLIENIARVPKESSEIELKLGFDQDGTLNAEAGDPGSGQYESLSISMETLGESSMYDIPEFSLDDDMEDLQIDDFDSLEEEIQVPELAEGVEGDSDELILDDEDFDFDDLEEEDSLEAEDFDMEVDDEELFDESSEDITEDEFEETSDSDLEDEDDYTSGILSESEMVHGKEKKGGNPLLIALLVIIAIAAIAGISYLLFRSLQGEDSPALEATHSTSSGTAQSTGSGVDEETVSKVESEAPSESIVENAEESTNGEQPKDETTAVPELAVQESTKILDTTGVWYKIRWGDTLWGISYSFYDSPRNYSEIAKENKIKNPDIIFAETEIFIPSR